MQSGLKKTKSWVVEFQFDPSLKKDVLMGWSSSKNTNKQIKLLFSNLEDAKSWCLRNNFSYVVEDQSLKAITPKNYSSNFSNTRRTSWTH